MSAAEISRVRSPWRGSLSLCFCVFLGACAVSPAPTFHHPPPPANTGELPAVAKDRTSLADMLADYAALNLSNADSQRKALLAAQSEFEQRPATLSRLKLALILSLPRALRDDARLLTLLAPIVGALPEGAASKSTVNTDWQNLALLLHTQAADRLRSQRLEQRRHEVVLREEQRRSEDFRQKADELKQKLEALMQIEKDVRRKR